MPQPPRSSIRGSGGWAGMIVSIACHGTPYAHVCVCVCCVCVCVCVCCVCVCVSLCVCVLCVRACVTLHHIQPKQQRSLCYTASLQLCPHCSNIWNLHPSRPFLPLNTTARLCTVFASLPLPASLICMPHSLDMRACVCVLLCVLCVLWCVLCVVVCVVCVCVCVC